MKKRMISLFLVSLLMFSSFAAENKNNTVSKLTTKNKKAKIENDDGLEFLPIHSVGTDAHNDLPLYVKIEELKQATLIENVKKEKEKIENIKKEKEKTKKIKKQHETEKTNKTKKLFLTIVKTATAFLFSILIICGTIFCIFNKEKIKNFWTGKKTIDNEADSKVENKQLKATFFPRSIHRVEIFKTGSWLFFLKGRNFKNEWVSLERKSDTPPTFIVEKEKHYKIYLSAEEKKPFTINKITDVKDTNTNGYLGESLHNAYPDTFLLENEDKNSKTSVSTTLFKRRSKSLPPPRDKKITEERRSSVPPRNGGESYESHDEISNKSSSSGDSTLKKIDDNNENEENIKKFEKFHFTFKYFKKKNNIVICNNMIDAIDVCQNCDNKLIEPREKDKNFKVFYLDWTPCRFTYSREDKKKSYLIKFFDTSEIYSDPNNIKKELSFTMSAGELINKFNELFDWLPTENPSFNFFRNKKPVSQKYKNKKE